jgi:hypothetical protein
VDLDDLTIRSPVPGDVPRIAALMADSFDTYRDFAPHGWIPPTIEEHETTIANRLFDPTT